LQPVVITLELHLVHHSMSYDEQNANFGAVLSIWDRLFGTFVRLPRAEQDRLVFGVRELPARECLKLSAMLLTPCDFLAPRPQIEKRSLASCRSFPAKRPASAVRDRRVAIMTTKKSPNSHQTLFCRERTRLGQRSIDA
jgi:hypothetical protein